ncbi:hypothetical protein VNO78_16098 [Psophocarpus tetragonolobus]|uniref:Uncharacterized protein n=1 Tax=Psophocarpus tetragonolobus TaxID=3891 RepID=A0AAN9SLN9_PSOTE
MPTPRPELGGGITLSLSKNENCPISVMKEPKFGIGLALEFSSPGRTLLPLREGDYLTESHVLRSNISSSSSKGCL